MKKKNGLDAGRSMLLLLVAAAILIGAFVWRILLEKNGLAPRIAAELYSHGLKLDPAELEQNAHRADATIREMLADAELDALVAASERAGFPSDVDKRGEVYCLLAALNEKDVLPVFVVNARVELAFVQTLGSGDVRAVNEQAEGERTGAPREEADG